MAQRDFSFHPSWDMFERTLCFSLLHILYTRLKYSKKNIHIHWIFWIFSCMFWIFSRVWSFNKEIARSPESLSPANWDGYEQWLTVFLNSISELYFSNVFGLWAVADAPRGSLQICWTSGRLKYFQPTHRLFNDAPWLRLVIRAHMWWSFVEVHIREYLVPQRLFNEVRLARLSLRWSMKIFCCHT